MKLLFLIPPFTQINTTYPSITQLAGYFTNKNHDCLSIDLSIKVFLKIFSKNGLTEIFSEASKSFKDEESVRFDNLKNQYINNVDSVIKFLQGKDPNLAYTLSVDGFLPQGESFINDVDEQNVFGYLGIQDKAKYYCSLFIDDLTKFIQRNIDQNFGLSRYAEKISVSLPTFDPILSELKNSNSIVKKYIGLELENIFENFNPELIAISVPFPGNLLGAIESAKFIKNNFPEKIIVLGGGYVNTELRKIKDFRIFDFIDYLTYDDGEIPLEKIIENISGQNSSSEWVRTLSPQKNIYPDFSSKENVNHNELFAPSLNGINPDEYISMAEMLNPMHRLWSDGYWNKLTTAHGCYWHKCSFCDTSLDYINRYSPAKAKTIVDWMEDLINQSGRNSFHFTDEAAPPVLLKEIALEILNRNLKVSWWGNIRYEKAFTSDVCKLLALSGCVAVSGGIEVANNRLLKLINKGVSIEQVTNVCANFINAGIMTHAYLMFGFPTQTEQEIVDSLEIVRQLTESELITSAFWHQFALTYHSPVYIDQSKFKVKVFNSPDNKFANNDLHHEDITKLNYKKYSFGLNKALYNFMHGSCFDWHSNKWFDFPMPRTKVNRNLIEEILNSKESLNTDFKKIFWFGNRPVIIDNSSLSTLIIHSNTASAEWDLPKEVAKWLEKYLQKCGEVEIKKFKKDCPVNFYEFLNTEIFFDLKELGLITI